MSTITKTIGATGDYTTPALAAVAFNAGTVAGASAADDIVFNIIDNAAFDSTFLITANPTGYASYTITVDPSVRHNGTYGSGARFVLSTVKTEAVGDSVSALNGTFAWLEITTTGAGKISRGVSLTAGFSAGKVKTVQNCMLHDNGGPTTTPFRVVGIGDNISGGGNVCQVTVIDTLVSNWTSGSTADAAGIGGSVASGATGIIENCTVDGIDVTGGTSGTVTGIGTANFANKTLKNNVVTNIGANTSTGTKKCFAGNGGSTTGANNASDDATAFGTGSLTNIVRGNNFNAPNSGDFRPLNNSSPIFAAGADLVTTPTGVNIDLKGRDRHASGDTWSIGAYQLSVGGVVSNGITISAPAPFRMHQRVAGVATVAVSGTYTGTVTNVEVQIDAGSWATLASGPTGGTYSGTVSVSAGTRSISVRFSNDHTTTATVASVLVGDVFLVVGQSNASGRLTNPQSYTNASQKAAVYDEDDTTWRELIDPTDPETVLGSCWPLLATQFLANQTVPIGFVTAANGGTAINTWWSTTAQSEWTGAKARVSLIGINAIAGVLWDQGESDCLAGAGPTTQAAYKASLDGLIGDTQSVYGVPFICAQVGTEPSTSTAASLDAIRKAQEQSISGTTGAKQGPVEYYRANEHFQTDNEGLLQAAGWWLAIEAALFSGSNGHGPRVSSCALNVARTQVTVVFDRILKTGLTFSTAPWSVSDNGTPATVSGVAYHGSNTSAVVLTLSGALSGPANSCTVTFATGNTGAGVVVPKSTDITMPSGSAVQIVAEPFYVQSVNETAASQSAGRLGLSLGIGL